MKFYLSFGGGVNSVAMMLMFLDQKEEFEAIFVDHETDWPETYEYFEMFQGWLKEHGHQPIITIKATSLYDYALSKSMVPATYPRWCTRQFKLSPIMKYYKKPCFNMLGIASDESKRAKLSVEKGVENRFPLIEADIDRDGCKQIILGHGLPLPMKSGCYICPFQRRNQWVELRTKHPDLFCKAQQLEKKNMEYRESKGKVPLTLSPTKKPLNVLVNEDQMKLFEEMEYPPCHCGL